MNAGNRFAFQQTRILSERLGIGPSIKSTDKYHNPPPVKEGYKNLGYYIPQSIHFRDSVSKEKGILSSENEKKLNYHLNFCRLTGNFPEIWKLILLGIRKNPKWRKDSNKIKEMKSDFRICEYSLIQYIGYELIFLFYYFINFFK